MATNTISPNMNLVIPTVGQEQGPTYAFDVNSSLTLIDQHDHSPGRGVQITPAGMNINADLSMNGFSLLAAATIVFNASGSASTTPMSLSVAPGGESPQQEDLWYTPDTGVPIQITKNGIVNVVAASIPGESYAAGTFFWTQEQDALPTTPANFDIGSIVLRPNVALTTFGVNLHPPSSISSQYDINLPILPPGAAFVTIDNSGNMGTVPFPLTGTNIASATITGSNIAPATITGGNIAADTITGANIADDSIPLSKLETAVLQWQSATFTTPVPSFAVKTATLVNITLSGAQTIDGIPVVAGDIVLVKNQTTTSNDGVYTVAAGAWSRNASYNTFTLLNGAMVNVSFSTPNTAGTLQTQGGSYWFQNNTLTSLSDPQSWSTTGNSQSWTVPTDVNSVRILYCGGGGGGGGSKNGATNPTGAAGGGGGATPYEVFLPVTSGLVFTITPGGNGGPGNGGTNTGNGGNGGDGGDTIISATGISLLGQGASGAAGSTQTATGPGASTYSSGLNYAGISVSNGGDGGGTSANVGQPGTKGYLNYYSGTGAASGAVAGAGTSGGGGGGGGSGFGIGGAGGAGGIAVGAVNGSPGVDAAVGNYGAGGGGAGGSRNTQTLGAHGGRGATGVIVFSWLGNPT